MSCQEYSMGLMSLLSSNLMWRRWKFSKGNCNFYHHRSPSPTYAAVYGLLGAKSIELLIDSAILSLFGNIIRDIGSTERAIAAWQLAVKPFNSNSWFMKVLKRNPQQIQSFILSVILSVIHLWKKNAKSSPALQSKITGMLRLLTMPGVNHP